MNGNGWTIATLANELGAEKYGTLDVRIGQVLTDSRQLSFPSDTVFFAIRTYKNDGHRYIPELFAKGVRVFVVDHLPQIHRDDAVFLVVKDTLQALQDLAAAWRERFEYPVLAITGSNGKTVVKEWIHQLLNAQFRVVRSPRSFNSQIGVPLSVLHMRAGHQLAIFEAGISQVDEMNRLERIIQPSWGILTNIGDAHQEHFADRDIKLTEKLSLFKGVKRLIYNSDQPEVNEKVKELFGGSSDMSLLTWGSDKSQSDLWVSSKRAVGSETQIEAVWKAKKIHFQLPFTDEASVENAMHALTFSLGFGVGAKVLVNAVKRLTPIAMRLELKRARGGSSLINDAYSSDLQSVRIALDFTAQQTQHNRRIVILTDLEQSGMDEEQLYREIADMLEERKVDLLLAIGPQLGQFKELFHVPSYFYPSTAAFISEMPLYDWTDAAILLKGARSYSLEKVAQHLEERAHQTVLEINMTSMVHNLNYFRKLLRPETKLMAMVKAFGYGTGAHEVANVLEYNNVDWLAVAYADEGVALRKAGISTRIMVMNPGEESFEQLLEFGLEPEIYSLSVLQSFHRAVQQANTETENSAVPIHIKIETGMHRLGFEVDEMDVLADELLAMPGIRVATAFTHLAASDDPEESEFTNGQVEALKRAAQRLEEGLGYPFLKHALNSSGIHNYIGHQLDMVRLGIGLYGVSSVSWERHHLQFVGRLITRISQIKSIHPGDSVGYSRSFVAERSMQIATLPIGYADGIDRRLSNGKGEVWLNGQRASIIGRVCMDMIMVDVSTIDCEVGDEVEIFGQHISIYEFAERVGTIPYEVLTSISSRVKRIYYQE